MVPVSVVRIVKGICCCFYNRGHGLAVTWLTEGIWNGWIICFTHPGESFCLRLCSALVRWRRNLVIRLYFKIRLSGYIFQEKIPDKLSDFSDTLTLERTVSSLDCMGVRIHWQMRTIPTQWRYSMGLTAFMLQVTVLLQTSCILVIRASMGKLEDYFRKHVWRRQEC